MTDKFSALWLASDDIKDKIFEAITDKYPDVEFALFPEELWTETDMPEYFLVVKNKEKEVKNV